MKIQKILTSLFAAAAILCSCEKEQEGLQLPGEIKTDLKFHTLEVVDISYNSATLSVKHDGTSSDTWYGFVSGNPGKSDAILIADKISEIIANGDIKKLNKRTSARVELTDLEPAKKYKYIVFAITPDGQIYGKSASVTFTTEESAFLLTQCDDWSITREGRSEKNEETYSIVFNKANAPRCHVGFIPKWMVEYYEGMPEIQAELEQFGGLRVNIGEQVFLFSIIDYLVFEELYEYWGYYEEDESYFANETFSESYTFSSPRQESGDYYAVCIGFDDGQPTYTYSVNDVTIEKEQPSESYNKWIGTWTITGANNISYNLKFEENDPNFSFYVYGWECSESVHNKECPENCTEHTLYTDFSTYKLGIPFYFNALNGEMSIKSTILGGEEVSGNMMYWGMFGYTKHEGETVSILTPEDNVASAAVAVDTLTTLNGLESVTYKYGADGSMVEEVKFTYSSLGYVQYDEQTYTPMPWNLPIELPAIMVKNEDVATASMNNNTTSLKAIRQANAIKSYTSIQKADYSRLVKADFLNKK